MLPLCGKAFSNIASNSSSIFSDMFNFNSIVDGAEQICRFISSNLYPCKFLSFLSLMVTIEVGVKSNPNKFEPWFALVQYRGSLKIFTSEKSLSNESVLIGLDGIILSKISMLSVSFSAIMLGTKSSNLAPAAVLNVTPNSLTTKAGVLPPPPLTFLNSVKLIFVSLPPTTRPWESKSNI